MGPLIAALQAQNKEILDSLTLCRKEAPIARNEAQHFKELYEQLKAEKDFREKLQKDKYTMPSMDEAVAYLQVRTVGKIKDETYIAYCGAILREYLSKRKRVPIMVERAIVNGALAIHFSTINIVTEWDMHSAMQFKRRLTPRSIFVAIFKLIITALVITAIINLF
ncbi:hypothetical protein KR067_011323 [Drosophila pandora]|nr:hypothetical protein KR067_011323 [Drosophila pandora]